MLTRARQRLGDERGFTLVEGLVAGLVLVIGIFATIGVFESSAHESATGERQQVAVAQAEAEIERLRDLPYEDLTVDSAQASWPTSATPGNPAARVVGGPPVGFKASPSVVEEMVISSTAGAGIGGYQPTSMPFGDSTLDFDVYRFVSWRDENCELIDITGLTSELDALLANLDQVTGPTFDLLDSVSGLVNQLLGGLLNLLPQNLRNLLPSADLLLDELQGVLAANRDEIQALRDGIVEIDPCDLDVQALGALQEIRLIAEVVNPALQSLDQLVQNYRSQCLLQILIPICPGANAPVTQALVQGLNNLPGVLEPDSIDADLQAIAAALTPLDGLHDNPRNTKRVTVAIVLDPRTSTGPVKPVWATSVVSDPEAGLLTGP